MTTKLTPAQRIVLQHLADGDRIYRLGSKLFGDWIITGPWGTVKANDSTVNILVRKGLTSISEREHYWRYVRLTDLGRLALAASGEDGGDA